MHRAVVIPTRDRHRLLFDAVNSVIGQVDRVVIIDNGSEPAIQPDSWGEMGWWESGKLQVMRYTEDPPNISRLWNMGIDVVAQAARGAGYPEWDVIVLNSDVVVPHHWVERLSAAMRSTPAVLAYPDQFNGSQMILHTRPQSVPLTQRITGYAYMMRGEVGLRLDETMQWWYSDDDLDWTARTRGGALLVPGLGVEHREPNGSTNARQDLQVQAGKDRITFQSKWGRTPH